MHLKRLVLDLAMQPLMMSSTYLPRTIMSIFVLYIQPENAKGKKKSEKNVDKNVIVIAMIVAHTKSR